MSSMVKCDCCKRIDYTDSRSNVRYIEVYTNGKINGFSTRHLCEDCYRKKFLLELFGIDIED